MRRHLLTPSLWTGVAATGVMLLAGVVLGASQASAQSRGSWFAGGNLDEDDSGYLGAQAGVLGGRAGAGWAVRGVVTGGTYSYSRGARDIDARFVGGQVGPIYQWSDDHGYTDVGLAARYVNTHLSPYDPLNRRRGGVGDALVSLDGARRYGRWQVTGYGEYGTGIEDYLVRASLTHAFTERLRVGPEVIFQGDPTYDRQRVGLLFGLRTTALSEIQVSGGISDQSSRSTDAYVSLAFTHSF